MYSDVVLYDRVRAVNGDRSPHARLVSLVAENVGGIANHYARRKIHYAGGIPDVVVLKGKKVRAIHEIEVPWGKPEQLGIEKSSPSKSSEES